MSAGTVQVGLAPLVRAEALHLLGGIRMGLVVCADRGLTVHRSGFHTLVGAELVVRTPMGTEVDPAQEAGLPVTYRAESLDEWSLLVRHRHRYRRPGHRPARAQPLPARPARVHQRSQPHPAHPPPPGVRAAVPTPDRTPRHPVIGDIEGVGPLMSPRQATDPPAPDGAV